jgi:hypothetical protein
MMTDAYGVEITRSTLYVPAAFVSSSAYLSTGYIVRL